MVFLTLYRSSPPFKSPIFAVIISLSHVIHLTYVVETASINNPKIEKFGSKKIENCFWKSCSSDLQHLLQILCGGGGSFSFVLLILYLLPYSLSSSNMSFCGRSGIQTPPSIFVFLIVLFFLNLVPHFSICTYMCYLT
jgi:hypothetical protein